MLAKLNEAGVPCGILMAPILPGLSDSPEQLEATVQAAADAGATFISPILLHLRPGVKEEFMPWLEDNHPELLKNYEAIYKRTNAPKDVSEPVQKMVANLRRKYGYADPDPSAAKRRGNPATKKAAPQKHQKQLSLDLDEPKPARKVPKWVSGKLSESA